MSPVKPSFVDYHFDGEPSGNDSPLAVPKLEHKDFFAKFSAEGRLLIEQCIAREKNDHDDTPGHVARVEASVLILARAMGFQNPVEVARQAALHDIGKRMPAIKELISQPRLLELHERPLVESHTVEGAKMLLKHAESLPLDIPAQRFFREASRIALGHHENWTGNGYPLKLQKEEIQNSAAIVKVADVYDAKRSARSYKAGEPALQVQKEMREDKKGEFSPKVIEALLDLSREIEESRLRADSGTTEKQGAHTRAPELVMA